MKYLEDFLFFERLVKEKHIQLTKQQYESILTNKGHHLLLACPGSGKTTVMVIKTAYLIKVLKIRPMNILTLTFSKAAAKDMQKKYQSIFGAHENGLKFSTIHSFCNKIMKERFLAEGIQKENLESKGNHSKNQIVCTLYTDLLKKKPTQEAIGEVLHALTYMKNHYLGWSEIGAKEFNIRYLKELYEAYEDYKFINHFYDYDDMLTFCYEEMKKNQEVLKQIRMRFTHIQIDEAQDNSALQNAILRLLITEAHHLFMVADDDQAIYEWRGASHRQVLDFQMIFKKGEVHRMEENFRSSRDIVDLSNQLIKNNHNRYKKNLITSNPAFEPVKIIKGKEVRRAYSKLMPYLQNSRKREQIVFLYRNNLSSIRIAHKLFQYNIPFNIRGYSEDFFNHWMVNDIFSFLFYAQTNETQYLETIYYKNDVYLSKDIFETAKRKCSEQSVLEVLCHSPNLKPYQLKRLFALKTQFKKLKKLPVFDGIEYIMEEMGYEKWVKSMSNSGSIEGFRNQYKLFRDLSAGIKNAEAYSRYLESLKQHLEKATNEHQSNGVTLSTIHGAKGLEFETVFFVDLDQNVFPGLEALRTTDCLEAERRLFYVGITRAKRNLYLISEAHKEAEVSQFIKEVENIISLSN